MKKKTTRKTKKQTKKSTNKNANIRVGLILVICALAVLFVFLYVLLHEIGHMIVMLCAGATITDFSIFGAHVSAQGGRYSYFTELLRHANGVLLPLIISYVCVLFYRKENEKLPYRVAAFFANMVPASSLLAWVVIPFSYISGNAPVDDDVTKFLDVFTEDFHPLTVSAAAAVLIGISIALMLWKKVLKNFIEAIRTAR